MNDDVSMLASPRWGHFDFGTGYHGDLWLDLDSMFLWPAKLSTAAGLLAGQLRPYDLAAVCGPWAGGAFLAQMVAAALQVAFLPASPGPGPAAGYQLPGPLRVRIGGWRVAIVDDAVNAGTAVRACCQQLRSAGAEPAAVAALLAVGPGQAVVAGELGLPFHALTSLASQAWPAADCPLCRRGEALTK